MCDDQLLELDSTPYSYIFLLPAIFNIFGKGRHWAGIQLLLELTMLGVSLLSGVVLPQTRWVAADIFNK